MKNIILLIIVACLCGCGQNMNKLNTQNQEPSFLLKERLDSLVEKSPNLMNNDITRQDFADLLTSEFQKHRGDTLPFLSDIPLKYEMCLVYPENPFGFESESFKNAGKYVVKFGFGETTSKCSLSNDYKTTFQVFTIMDKEQVASLIDNALYHVNGKFVDFANNSKETGFVLPSGKCVVDYPKVSTIDNKPYFMLGTLILENIIFTQIN